MRKKGNEIMVFDRDSQGSKGFLSVDIPAGLIVQHAECDHSLTGGRFHDWSGRLLFTLAFDVGLHARVGKNARHA